MKFNNIDFDTYFKNYPDANGYFGKYGGSYIPPELQVAMNEISEAYQTICKSRKFINELRRIRKEFQGRPTPISHLARLSDKIGTGVQLYVKREDLILLNEAAVGVRPKAPCCRSRTCGRCGRNGESVRFGFLILGVGCLRGVDLRHSPCQRCGVV